MCKNQCTYLLRSYYLCVGSWKVVHWLKTKARVYAKQGCARTNARGIPSMRWFLQGKGHKKVRILLLSLLLKSSILTSHSLFYVFKQRLVKIEDFKKKYAFKIFDFNKPKFDVFKPRKDTCKDKCTYPLLLVSLIEDFNKQLSMLIVSFIEDFNKPLFEYVKQRLAC